MSTTRKEVLLIKFIKFIPYLSRRRSVKEFSYRRIWILKRDFILLITKKEKELVYNKHFLADTL